MSHILYNVQIAPGAEVFEDVAYKRNTFDSLGQLGMLPITVFLSKNHSRIEGNAFQGPLQQISVAKKVAVLFVSVLLLPVTLLGLVLGSIILSLSKTHRLNTCLLDYNARESRQMRALAPTLNKFLKDYQERISRNPSDVTSQEFGAAIEAMKDKINADKEQLCKEWLLEFTPLILSVYEKDDDIAAVVREEAQKYYLDETKKLQDQLEELAAPLIEELVKREAPAVI